MHSKTVFCDDDQVLEMVEKIIRDLNLPGDEIIVPSTDGATFSSDFDPDRKLILIFHERCRGHIFRYNDLGEYELIRNSLKEHETLPAHQFEPSGDLFVKTEGTVLSVYLDGEDLMYSTFKSINAGKSRWGSPETFLQKFERLLPKSVDLKEILKGREGSVLHFMIMDKDLQQTSHISVGTGYLIFLGETNVSGVKYYPEVTEVFGENLFTPPRDAFDLLRDPSELLGKICLPFPLSEEGARRLMFEGIYEVNEPEHFRHTEPVISISEGRKIVYNPSSYFLRSDRLGCSPNVAKTFFIAAGMLRGQHRQDYTVEMVRIRESLFRLAKLGDVKGRVELPFLTVPMEWRGPPTDPVKNLFLNMMLAVPQSKQEKLLEAYYDYSEYRGVLVNFILNDVRCATYAKRMTELKRVHVGWRRFYDIYSKTLNMPNREQTVALWLDREQGDSYYAMVQCHKWCDKMIEAMKKGEVALISEETEETE